MIYFVASIFHVPIPINHQGKLPIYILVTEITKSHQVTS